MAMMKVLCLCLLIPHTLCDEGWNSPLLQGSKVSEEELLSLGRAVDDRAHQRFLSTRKPHIESMCPRCTGKDYTDACPQNWNELQDGLCLAPSSYTGPCATQKRFIGASEVDKQEMELTCGICWNCPSDTPCTKDWTQPCPHGYTAENIDPNMESKAGPVCVADLDYQGPCEPRVEFHSAMEKQSFAKRCSVSWPCVTHCEDSIPSICPHDWDHVGSGICAAPSNYKMDGCKSLLNFAGWTPQAKKEYASQCNVVWPCGSEATQEPATMSGPLTMMECKTLDTNGCPRTWVLSQDGFCQPGRDAVGPCESAVHVAKMSQMQKLFWAAECLLAWPCASLLPDVLHANVPFKIVAGDNGPVSNIDDIVNTQL